MPIRTALSVVDSPQIVDVTGRTGRDEALPEAEIIMFDVTLERAAGQFRCGA